MPVSALGLYWPIMKRLIECRPSSILDLGCGTGRFGVCVRDYLEDLLHQVNPAHPREWRLRIEGVEIFEGYRSVWGTAAYDRIHHADALDFMRDGVKGGRMWDVTICTAMIEHLTFADAQVLLGSMVACSKQYAIVGAPYGKHEQEEGHGNKWEQHQFEVNESFFDIWRHRMDQLWLVDGSILAVIKGGSPQGKPPPNELVYRSLL